MRCHYSAITTASASAKPTGTTMTKDLYRQPMPTATPAISGNFQLEASSLAGDQARAKNTPNSQKVSGALVSWGRP